MVHLLLKSNLENAVRLVNDQGLEVLVNEAVGVLEVVQQPARRGDDDADALDELLGLRPPVGPAHHNTIRLLVVPHQLGGHLEDLERELPGGGDDDDAGAVPGLPLHLGQELHGGNQERQGLAASGLGLAKHIAAGEEGRDGPLLDLGHGGEPHVLDGILGGLRQVKRGELVTDALVA